MYTFVAPGDSMFSLVVFYLSPVNLWPTQFMWTSVEKHDMRCLYVMTNGAPRWSQVESGSLVPVCSVLHCTWWPNPSRQPGQGHALSLGPVLPTPHASWPSPHLKRCHREQPCSSTLASFHPVPPSKIPDIPAISGAMFIWQNECSGGREVGRGVADEQAVLRKSLTHKQLGLHWKVNMYRRGVWGQW